jgi:hypothetical protein
MVKSRQNAIIFVMSNGLRQIRVVFRCESSLPRVSAYIYIHLIL